MDSNKEVTAIRINHGQSNQEKLYLATQEEEKKEEAKDAKAAKEEETKKKEGGDLEKAQGNATAGNATSGNYTWEWGRPEPKWVNWYDIGQARKEEHKLKDDTPMNIKSHPVYKQMIGRFINGHFKDKDLETMKKQNAKDTINHEEIGEEKEREGMYPNELDQEIQGYKYGDKLHPGWSGYYGAGSGTN